MTHFPAHYEAAARLCRSDSARPSRLYEPPSILTEVLDPRRRRRAVRELPVQTDRHPLGALTPEGARCVTRRSAAEFHHASVAIG